MTRVLWVWTRGEVWAEYKARPASEAQSREWTSELCSRGIPVREGWLENGPPKEPPTGGFYPPARELHAMVKRDDDPADCASAARAIEAIRIACLLGEAGEALPCRASAHFLIALAAMEQAVQHMKLAAYEHAYALAHPHG